MLLFLIAAYYTIKKKLFTYEEEGGERVMTEPEKMKDKRMVKAAPDTILEK